MRRDLGVRAKVHDEIVRKLGAAILDGTYGPGDRLPNEEALQNLFGVSRTSVREAVKFLSAKGMIEARPRLGMVVRRREAWSLLDPEVLAWRHDGIDGDLLLVRSLLEARLAIEPAAAALAAERASPDDLTAMAEALAAMAANLPNDTSGFCRADLDFHKSIIIASGNVVFRHLIATIDTALEASFRLSGRWTDEPQAVIDAHRAVLVAIEQRRPEAARARMVELVGLASRDLEPALAGVGYRRRQSVTASATAATTRAEASVAITASAGTSGE